MAALAGLGDRLFLASSGPAAGKNWTLPRIWTEPDVFRAATDLFRAKTKSLAVLARAGELAGVRRQLGVVGKTGCIGCHVGFRACQLVCGRGWRAAVRPSCSACGYVSRQRPVLWPMPNAVLACLRSPVVNIATVSKGARLGSARKR